MLSLDPRRRAPEVLSCFRSPLVGFSLCCVVQLMFVAGLAAQAAPAKPAAVPKPAAAPAKPGAPAAAAGDALDTDALREQVGLILQAERLKKDGRGVRARRLLARAGKGFDELFAEGKSFSVGEACPLLVRGKPGAQRIGLACFPAGAEGRFVFKFYTSNGVFTNKEHLTADDVAASIEDFRIFQEFTGKLQVVQDLTGKHRYDLERLVVYVKFEEVAAVGGPGAQKPEKPGAPAQPGAAAAGEGEKVPEPEPASLEDEFVMRCRAMLALPVDPPEKPVSQPRVEAPRIGLQRCESSEAICILRGKTALSCWPKSK